MFNLYSNLNFTEWSVNEFGEGFARLFVFCTVSLVYETVPSKRIECTRPFVFFSISVQYYVLSQVLLLFYIVLEPLLPLSFIICAGRAYSVCMTD